MGLRFRRTVKLFPGVRLNLSRSGVSTTVGVRGASVTVGKKGTYANVGVPGSGVSYRTRIDGETETGEQRLPEGGRKRSPFPLILVLALAGGGVLAFQTLTSSTPKPAAPVAAAPVAAAPAVPVAKAAETVTIAKRSTAVRAAPSRKSEKLGTAKQGDQFTVFSRQGVWLEVGHDRPEGWISASATRP
jgi:hypothetical protein